MKNLVSNLKGQKQEEKNQPLLSGWAQPGQRPSPFQPSTHRPPLPALGASAVTPAPSLSAQEGDQLRQSCPETQGGKAAVPPSSPAALSSWTLSPSPCWSLSHKDTLTRADQCCWNGRQDRGCQWICAMQAMAALCLEIPWVHLPTPRPKSCNYPGTCKALTASAEGPWYICKAAVNISPKTSRHLQFWGSKQN